MGGGGNAFLPWSDKKRNCLVGQLGAPIRRARWNHGRRFLCILLALHIIVHGTLCPCDVRQPASQPASPPAGCERKKMSGRAPVPFPRTFSWFPSCLFCPAWHKRD